MIRVSGYYGVNVIKCQGIRVVRVSGYHGIRVSRYQGSWCKGVMVSGCHGIISYTAKLSGVLFASCKRFIDTDNTAV